MEDEQVDSRLTIDFRRIKLVDRLVIKVVAPLKQAHC